eukprot:g37876.t1
MCNIESSKQQLLSEEHAMLEKLGTLDKELDSVRQRGATSDEGIFLRSKEAKFAQEQLRVNHIAVSLESHVGQTSQLFEEENKAVKRLFREVSECSSDHQQIPKLS